jgi:heterodisulfide reductase subunit A-like polyferredoxin
MKGIQYVVDEAGEKTAVMIDLREYGELWEDFYDRVVAHSRQDEPRESLESVKESLRRHGKLDG